MCFDGGLGMLRRQFFRSTIGALVGAVCAPFVGKAAEPLAGPQFQFGSADELITYLEAHKRRMFEEAYRCVEEHIFRLPLTQEQRDA
jgi:hypothetical protein